LICKHFTINDESSIVEMKGWLYGALVGSVEKWGGDQSLQEQFNVIKGLK